MNKKVAKKKKSKLIKTRLFTAIFSVMFVVSLFMGINALAETNPFSLTNATIEEKSATTTGSIQSFDNEKVNNDIAFHKLNDYVTYKLVIKNNNNDITILSITDDNSNEYIAYEYDKHENEKVNKGSSINFLVKAIYKNELTDTSKRNQTTNVKFTITYLENGEVKGDIITINPKTGDGISKSFMMLIISSVGLVTCIALDKKRKNKKLSKVSMFIITGLLITPIIVKAATFAYSLSLVTNVGLYNKIVVTIDDKINEPTKQTIEYNTTLDSLPSPTKEGYTLTNWTVNNEEFDITKEIKEDITIEANYRKNNYTITFNANVPVGGTLDPATSMADMDMKYDEEKNLLPNGYLVTGYNFDSWNTMPDGSGTKYEDMDSVKNLTSTDGETVTLYARWGATPYTVVFDKNSTQATGTMENISKAYNETFNLPENTYERTGYGFAGWNTASNGTGIHYDNKQSVKNLDIDGEVTLYAEWTPVLVTINFDINTDDPNASGTMAGQIVVYDVQNTINENTYTRTGYAFDSWNTEPDGSGTKYDDKADITNVFLDNTTLYAQWAVTPYTVIFNKNGGVGDQMPNQEIAYGEEVNLTPLGYSKANNIFVGWDTQADGTGTRYEDGALVKNLDIDGEVNLYAQWKIPVVDFVAIEDLRIKMGSISGGFNNIKQFIPYPSIPDLDNINYEIVSTDESDFPIYLWYDSSNSAVYYWCEWPDAKIYGSLTDLFANTSLIEVVDFSKMNLDAVTSTYNLFAQKTKLRSVDFGDWTASNVTNMERMFYYASSLETVDLSNFNTTSLQGSLEGMFDHCESLQSIDFGDNFNTSNVTSMRLMFQNCSSLEELDLSSFNTGNVTNMYYMFAGCTNLSSIVFGQDFNTSKVTDMGWMFFNCRSLTTLDLSTFSSNSLSKATAMFRFTSLNTIYATNSFRTDMLSDSITDGKMLFADTSLVGGAGTSFSVVTYKDSKYGRVDDPDNGQPGYYTLKGSRYIRYNKNGADGSETMTSHYLTNTGSLKANTFTNTGKTFAGWNTKADGSGDSYTDEQLMSDLTESKTPLTLYAQWE